MVGKRALLALAAVLVHAGAIAAPCDGLQDRCLDYTNAMMRLALTVQELQATGCEYQIAPSDAKRIAWVYTRYMKLTEAAR